jgi:hypothetical protein
MCPGPIHGPLIFVRKPTSAPCDGAKGQTPAEQAGRFGAERAGRSGAERAGRSGAERVGGLRVGRGRETGVRLYQVFAEWFWKSIAGKAIPGFIHGLI